MKLNWKHISNMLQMWWKYTLKCASIHLIYETRGTVSVWVQSRYKHCRFCRKREMMCPFTWCIYCSFLISKGQALTVNSHWLWARLQLLWMWICLFLRLHFTSDSSVPFLSHFRAHSSLQRSWVLWYERNSGGCWVDWIFCIFPL